MTYFDDLRTGPAHLVKHEGVAVAPNTELALLTDTGPGVVESIWMAVSGGDAPCLDGRLRITNGGDLNVDIDLGTLLVTHWGASGVFGNEHVSVDYTGALGVLLTFPIPYGSSGIRVGYYNPSATQGAFVYSMVTYRHLATDLGRRLRCQGRRYADQRVLRAAGSDVELASFSGNPGSLVYVSLVGGVDATADTWMERNFAVTVDGSTDIESSGTEDFFDSAWYFNQRKNYRVSPHSFVGTDKPTPQPHCVGMATDLWTKLGGIPFTSSCVVETKTEAAVTTDDTASWCVLYYQQI